MEASIFLRGFPVKRLRRRRPYVLCLAGFCVNWNAPILLSPQDKNTLYFGGNVVFKSTDFGKSWEQISADLTTNDPAKQKDAGGPVAFENSTAEDRSV
jgi:hypothetical protein